MFWFDVPPDAALTRRNGEESPDMLRKQAEYARILAAELGANRLDANVPLGEISDRLVTDVLRSYFDAHHTVLNAFFFANPKRLPTDWQEYETNEHGSFPNDPAAENSPSLGYPRETVGVISGF